MNSREASRKSRQSRNTIFRNNVVIFSTKPTGFFYFRTHIEY